jgi:hypothetical protein
MAVRHAWRAAVGHAPPLLRGPHASKRFDHVDTRFAVVFNCVAISATPTPSSLKRMISARSRSRTKQVLARSRRRRNSSATAGSASSRLIGRAIAALLHANQFQANIVDI